MDLLRENMEVISDIITGEQRMQDRLSADISVEITGFDHAGHLFSECTIVKDVTDIGCRFDTRAQLQCGDIVLVKPLEPREKISAPGQPQLFEVVWAGHHKAGCTVGARKFQVTKSSEVKFPPPGHSPAISVK